MRRIALVAIGLAVCLAGSGCSTGKPKVKVSGKVTRDGQPLQGRIHLTYIPFVEGGGTPLSTYDANVSEDGSYSVAGKQGKGIPPGKYRIAVRILEGKKSDMKEVTDPQKSPIIREVTAKRSKQEINIDLARPME